LIDGAAFQAYDAALGWDLTDKRELAYNNKVANKRRCGKMIIPILPLLLLVVLCFAVYVVIKNRWYSQALLVTVALLGVVCSLLGLRRITDPVPANDSTGIVVLFIGAGALIGDGWLAMKFRKSKTISEPRR